MLNISCSRWSRLFIFFFIFLCCSCIQITTTAQPTLQLAPIISNLSSPVDIVNAGDKSKRLFIVEKTGKIKIYKRGKLLTKPFLDLRDSVSTTASRGLLSMAFHPDFINNHYFFVYYTSKNRTLTLARFKTSATKPDSADKSSEVILIVIPEPVDSMVQHNGGKLNFGKDGYLYLSIGDGSYSGGDPANHAQDKSLLFGKMIRIDVNNFSDPPYYSIPVDNPFVSDPVARKEIWALGLRNPWRWSFDRRNGDTWIADVGEDSTEEINYKKSGTTPGENYGWRCYEGSSTYNPDGCSNVSSYIFPIFEYFHNTGIGGNSVIGGYVYRGAAFPDLQGYYICADYISGNAWKIKKSGNAWQSLPQQGLLTGITTFGEDESGELYAARSDNKIYKISATTLPATKTMYSTKHIDDVISIYPTLVYNHLINVSLKSPVNEIKILDIMGRTVTTQWLSPQTGNIQLNLPLLPAGIYVVKVTGARINFHQKIFISR